MNYNYQIRPNNDFKLITNKESKCNSTTKILKESYNYIFKSMQNENYKIEYDTFEIIQEIIDDDKVVGIISFINLDSFEHVLCINEVYILPEHRKKGLFYHTLLNLISQPNISVTIRNPNKTMIDLLVQYEFAEKLDNNLVISYFEFYVDYSKRYINKNIREYYNFFEKQNQKELIKSNFYDLNINSCVFFDLDNIFEFNENPPFIEKARKIDSSRDNYFLKLKNVDTTYLDILFRRFLNTDKVINHLSNQIEKMINQKLNVNDILGTDKKLTSIFLETLNQNNLTREDGFYIRQCIINALENNEIIPKTIILRTMYLIKHIWHKDSRVSKNLALGNDFEEECPYCLTLNNNFLEVCKVCGYNIQRNNHFEDNLPQIIGKNFILNHLSSEILLKEEIDTTQNKLNDNIYSDINYMDYNKKDVYETQCKISAYQLLTDIREFVYFDIIDYDTINNIRQGSTYDYAKKQNLIKKLTDYTLYFEVMEIFFSDDELRDILNRNNLNTNGKREDLINRIESQLSPIDIFGKKYTLTKKGFKFLDKHKNYDCYIEKLTRFKFYEVVNFKKHYTGNMKKFVSSFIKFMENISIEKNDFYKYHNVIEYQLENTEEDDLKYLLLFTELFIIEINHWLNNYEHEKGEKPLSLDIIEKFPNIKELFLDKDVIAIFNEANSSIQIDYLKDKEDITLFYLIKSLDYDDIEDVNREIEENTFEENFLKYLLKE